jgi:hypothetical protein
MLQFEDTDHFEDYISYLSQNHINLDEWEAEQGFHSTRSAFYGNVDNIELEHPLENDLLASVLNEDNMVIIRPWVFKLNASNKKVYVLHTDNIDKLSVLRSSETPSDHDIIDFDFEDNVLDLLSPHPTPPAARDKCAESVRGDRSIEGWDAKYTIENLGQGTRKQEVIKAIYRYNGWGILKTLYINFKHAERSYTLKDPNGGNPIWSTPCYKTIKVDHDYTTSGTYTKHDGTVVNIDYTSTDDGTNLTGSEVKKSDYQSDIWKSGKCFKAVDMNAVLFFESSMAPGTIMSANLGQLKTD